MIKIDVTPVLQGTIYEPETKSVGFAQMPVLSFADLYAGKIVAALDRQHPRDFFDTETSLKTNALMMPCAAPSSSIWKVTNDPCTSS